MGRSRRGIIRWGCEGKMSVDVEAVKMGSRMKGEGGEGGRSEEDTRRRRSSGREVLGAQVMWKGVFSCLMIWSWHLNQQLSTRSVNSNFMNQYGVQPIPKSRVVHTFVLFVPCRTESTLYIRPSDHESEVFGIALFIYHIHNPFSTLTRLFE